MVRELRNHYSSPLDCIGEGEEIVITRRSKPVARLIPEMPTQPDNVNWAEAPEVTRGRSGERILTAEESLNLIQEAGGKW